MQRFAERTRTHRNAIIKRTRQTLYNSFAHWCWDAEIARRAEFQTGQVYGPEYDAMRAARGCRMDAALQDQT